MLGWSPFFMIERRKVKNWFVLFVAQGAYSGRSPFAPGTAGTAVAVLLYLLLATLPLAWYLAACVLTIAIAIWTADKAENLLGKRDASSIVIDEIAGYLVSMILLPPGWFFVVAAFFLFRIFDIIKPWPCGRLQDLHGGPGVVLDDIGAGIYTNAVLQAAVLVLTQIRG
jgi:phosphatidylglycerophosphatase A